MMAPIVMGSQVLFLGLDEYDRFDEGVFSFSGGNIRIKDGVPQTTLESLPPDKSFFYPGQNVGFV
jgi:hypothetical protein